MKSIVLFSFNTSAIPTLATDGFYGKVPFLVWQPYLENAIDGYIVSYCMNSQGGAPGTFNYIDYVPKYQTYYEHSGIAAGQGTWKAYYKIIPYVGGYSPFTESNISWVNAFAFYKDINRETTHLPLNALNNNYPNPYNPVTRIKYLFERLS